jgi:hypothetical protein
MRNWAIRTGLLFVGLAPLARADFMTPDVWNRGDAHTTYQQWETFASPTGPNPPNAPPTVPGAAFNPNGSANVVDGSGASFVTGGGNIYSPTAVVRIDATVPEYARGAAYYTTVLLQTRTQGAEATYTGVDGMRLTYFDGSSTHTIYPAAASELFRQTLGGGFGGELVDYAAVFHVPYSPGLLTFEIDAAGTSMSFDRLAVDTIVTRAAGDSPLLAGMNPTIGFVPVSVPEPGMGAAVVIGLLAALGRRRGR